MIPLSELQQLMYKWQDRIDHPVHSFDYKTAVSECINDLNTLIDNIISDELSRQEDYQSFLDDWEADSYLSSLEAHGSAA
jgi:hypothetical protein